MKEPPEAEDPAAVLQRLEARLHVSVRRPATRETETDRQTTSCATAAVWDESMSVLRTRFFPRATILFRHNEGGSNDVLHVQTGQEDTDGFPMDGDPPSRTGGVAVEASDVFDDVDDPDYIRCDPGGTAREIFPTSHR